MKQRLLSGELQAQERFGTDGRAAAFIAHQRLDYLNAAMQTFIARQEMVSIARRKRGSYDVERRPSIVQSMSLMTRVDQHIEWKTEEEKVKGRDFYGL